MIETFDFIPSINTKLEEFKTSIETLINKNNNHVKSIKRYKNKEYSIEITEDETFDDRKNKAETMMDQLDDIIKRTSLEIENVKLFEKKLNDLTKEIEQMKMIYENDKFECEKKITELEHLLLNEIETMRKDELKRHEEEMKREKEEFENRKNKERNKIENEYKLLMNQCSIYSEKMKLCEMNLDFQEVKQLEQWTNKKCSEVLFDSDKDDWSQNTSVFGDKIYGKSNLMFIVEDTNNNKFGGYLTSTIDKYDDYIIDKNAFVFSLKSNGRINGTKKFDISNSCYSFKIWMKSNSEYLFKFGYEDLGIFKKSYKNGGWTQPTSYNYEGISSALSGKNSYSTPYSMKRFIVIQMK